MNIHTACHSSFSTIIDMVQQIQ